MESKTTRLRTSTTMDSKVSECDVASSPLMLAAQRHEAALQTWREILPWQRDNEFILTHYRPASYSYFRSLASLCRLHNQSVNIYSHLIGLIVFITFSYWFHHELSTRYESASKTDTFVFDCFFLGAVLCLGFSTSFHTFANHSAEVCRTWLLLDMIGILCLTTGSFFPGVFYGFYCEPEVIRTYWSMVRRQQITYYDCPSLTNGLSSDCFSRKCLHRCLYSASIPNGYMEAFQNPHVRLRGLVRCSSHESRG